MRFIDCHLLSSVGDWLPLEGTGILSKVGAEFDPIRQLIANHEVVPSLSSRAEGVFMRCPVAKWWRPG
jgi:hypothetical protein